MIQVLLDAGVGPAEDVTDDALPAGQGTEGKQIVFTEDFKGQFDLNKELLCTRSSHSHDGVGGEA